MNKLFEKRSVPINENENRIFKELRSIKYNLNDFEDQIKDV